MTQIQFPTIPQDPKSESMLQSLKVLSSIIMDKNPTQYQSDVAAFLYMIGSAPREHDYLYYKVHEGTQELRAKYQKWYNEEIHSKGPVAMVEILNQNIGEFHDYFNQFQMTFYIINEHSKTDVNWEPMRDLIWGFYCSLFDAKKRIEFIDEVKNTITKFVNEEGVILTDPEEEIENYPYFGQAGEA